MAGFLCCSAVGSSAVQTLFLASLFTQSITYVSPKLIWAAVTPLNVLQKKSSFFSPFVFPLLAENPQQKIYCCCSDEGEVQLVLPDSAFSVITPGWISESCKSEWLIELVFYLCAFPLETIARNSWFHELFCKWHTFVGWFADVFLEL